MQWQGFAPQLKIHFNKQTFNRVSLSRAKLNPFFGNVSRCRNTSGVSHSAYLQIKIHCCWMLVTAMVQNTNTLCLDAKYIIAQIHNYTITQIHDYTVAQIHCCWMQVTPIGHKSAVADHGCLIRMRHDPTFPR